MTRWSDEDIEGLKEKYPTHPSPELVTELGRSEEAIRKKAERLGLEKETNHRTKYSVRNTDTINYPDEELNWFISGFVAGEGTFVITQQTNSDKKKFRFEVTMAEQDRDILYTIRDYLDSGSIYEYESRNERCQPEIKYSVGDLGEIVKRIIPFFDQYSFKDTHKQREYDEWKKKLYEQYGLHDAEVM